MIQGNSLSLIYNQKPILRAVSFEIDEKKATVFIGKSGAGKTTILRILAGLESSYEGSLLYEGQDIKALDQKSRVRLIGYVTQNYVLFPQMTVLENCLLALEKVIGLSKQEASEKVRRTLSLVGMGGYEEVYPSQLSGGQRQRVAIARALCLEPKILILDEPTSALDPENVDNLVMLLKQIMTQDWTLVISSQDMSFVRMIFDSIYLVNNGMIVEFLDRQKIATTAGSRIQTFLERKEML